MARVRYNLEQRVFIYDCYVKTNSYKLCRRKFRRKFLETTYPSEDTISKLDKKVRTHSILIDRKPFIFVRIKLLLFLKLNPWIMKKERGFVIGL
jgi:hypothetical protein